MVLRNPFGGGVAQPGTEVAVVSPGVTTVNVANNPYALGSGGLTTSNLSTPKGSVQGVFFKSPSMPSFTRLGASTPAGSEQQPNLSGAPLGGSSSPGSTPSNGSGLFLLAALAAVVFFVH